MAPGRAISVAGANQLSASCSAIDWAAGRRHEARRALGGDARLAALGLADGRRNTRFLEALDQPNLEVRRHDIVADPLPQGAFDPVHSRIVVSHLPEREQALKRMVAALKPGGWLVCEETDNISVTLVSPSDAEAPRSS